jgi:DNA-binding transcriptional ArsR family regulator
VERSTGPGWPPAAGPGGSGPDSFDERLKLQLEDLVSTMCKALNDPKRLMLLYALKERPRSVGDLCDALSVPQSNASQHLAVLRERGLVVTERQGNRVLYSLRYPALIDAVDILRSVMAAELDRQRQLHDLPVAAEI